MHHVFVSYSRLDEGWVESVVSALDDRKVDAWVDREDLPFSFPWFEKVKDAIEESQLFLICDSTSWQSSRPCRREEKVATELGTPLCRITVGAGIVSAVGTVLGALDDTPVGWREHTELSVLARDWERSHRPRSALVGSRQKDRLVESTRRYPRTTIVDDFVKASARRARWRSVGAAVAVVLVIQGFRIGGRLDELRAHIDDQLTDQAEIYERTHQAFSTVRDDPYAGLELAAASGGNESAANAQVIAAALTSPVPDDSFELPVDAVNFASSPIGDDVSVLGNDGQVWARPAGAGDIRSATPAPVVDDARRPSSLVAITDERSAVVQIERDGLRYRTVDLPGATGPTAFSPNERELAVAVGNNVAVVDIAGGRVRLLLVGGPAPLTDVAWSSDGHRIWATAGTAVVSWSRRDADLVIDEPDREFRALVPAASGDQAWLASYDGSVRRIELATGTEQETRRIDDAILAATVDPARETVLLVGATGIWLVSLIGNEPPTELEPTDCAVIGEPAWSLDGTRFYLPCARGPVVEMTAGGDEVRRIDLPEGGAQTLTVAPRTGDVIIGSVDGDLFVSDDTGLRTLQTTECGTGFFHVAIATDESAVLPVGNGAGWAACSPLLHRAGERWDRTSYFDNLEGANVAESATFSTSGATAAIGYADGTVVLHPTQAILPTQTITGVPGRVTGMLTAGDDLYVATAQGAVARIALCDSCVRNDALAEMAQTRLERAQDLGLVPTP